MEEMDQIFQVSNVADNYWRDGVDVGTEWDQLIDSDSLPAYNLMESSDDQSAVAKMTEPTMRLSGYDQHVVESSCSEEQQDQSDTKLADQIDQGKKRKKGEKRKREERFAFMTKSEVDYLEDGYRWRKYGQKAVKNSPFPRSYYKCTYNKCTVKKRLERSANDPLVVITTYEGRHCHHTPVTQRGSQYMKNATGFTIEQVAQTSSDHWQQATHQGIYHSQSQQPYIRTEIHQGLIGSSSDQKDLLGNIVFTGLPPA